MNPEKIKKELADLEASGAQWWHTIDLGHGILTPGRKDINQDIKNWKLDDESIFKDKRVLDIGAWDGGASFHAEKMGAKEVLAIDVAAWDIEEAIKIDEQGFAGREDVWWGTPEPFNFAKRALKSNVQSKVLSVYDIDKNEIGSFDIVIFAGVLYHLRHPLLALEKIFDILNPSGLLFVETQIVEGSKPLMVFLEKDEAFNDPANWWFPTPSCAKAMLRSSGFKINSSSSIGGRFACHCLKND